MAIKVDRGPMARLAIRPQQAMAALDPLLGALILGTWAASILGGVVISEAWKYFTLFPNDAWQRKGLVVLALAFTVAALLGDYGTAYIPTVTFWGDVEALGKTFWPLPLTSIANSLIACIVDCYLIHRLHALTKNVWMTIFLYALILLALGGYMIVFIFLVTGGNATHPRVFRLGTIMNFSAVAAVDLLIAAGLIWKLRTMRSTFAHTNTFLNRVMIGAIQTGSITAACSLLILSMFLKNPETDVSTAFLFQFAPLYTLTLLFNFNLRQAGPLRSGSTESRTGNLNNIRLSEGIHVHHSTIVTMDPDNTDLLADAPHRGQDDHDAVKPGRSESYSSRNVVLTSLNSKR
ncbi:hypothetical protein C8R47DRAFT_1226006 [Mycena vitilis]|nr:hypothetical protein C8R47DRAFT_1226006 [Mycena vitilis]